MEDGRDEKNVVDLTCADPGIRRDQAVTWLKSFRWIDGEKVVQGLCHATEKCRQPMAPLRHHFALCIEERTAEIPSFGHNTRERGSQQCDLCLIDDGEKLVPPHRERRCIKRCRLGLRHWCHPCSEITSIRRSSTRACAPGGTTAVDSRSSMIAGPEI